MASRRAQLRVLAAFSGLAVLLAGIGIHGLLAFVVTGRRREIAVRMALGAGSGRILRLVVGRGLVLAGCGVVLGLGGAYAAGASLQALLAGVSPTDLPTFGAAAGLALAMALAGSLWPALGALRVDPCVGHARRVTCRRVSRPRAHVHRNPHRVCRLSAATASIWRHARHVGRFRGRRDVTVTHHKNVAILVGGGPAPGINSVIMAATIRAQLEGIDVIGIRDGFEWLMQGNIDHIDAADDRQRQPDPLPRRVAHRHRARQSHAGSAAPRERGHLAAAAQRQPADHHRRRRHGVLGDEARTAVAGPHPRRPRAQDHRQRPRPAVVRGHVRVPDRAALRRGDRQEPDGRRQDDVALVFRDRDGTQGRAPRAGHRQGGRRDADDDPGGVLRQDASGSRRWWTRWPGPSSNGSVTAGATASRSSPRDWCSTSTRPTWPRSRTSSATRTATSASPRSTSARS